MKDYTVEIGEIPVRIQGVICCGQELWGGTFPDRSACCKWSPCHESAKEAEHCARKRVRKGFVVRKVHADE